MKDCLFCRIARHELDAQIIQEDDHTLAFLDIHPQAPGHTVVIPRVHAATLAELPGAEVGPLFSAVQTVARRLTQVLAADGLTLGINQGEVSGQTIPHLHVHLFPRFRDDGGKSVHSVVNNPPKEALTTIANKISRSF